MVQATEGECGGIYIGEVCAKNGNGDATELL